MKTIKPRPRVAGKVVVVTGASSVIGEAAARAFARAGARVGLAARRAQRLDRLAAEIQHRGDEALAGLWMWREQRGEWVMLKRHSAAGA